MAGPRRLTLLTILLLALVPVGSAHGDVRGVDEAFTIPAGGLWSMDVPVHYHRLVGHVQADDPDAVIQVTVTGPDGQSTPVAGPGSSLQVNHLIECCLDALWANHTLTLHNAGPSPVEVTAYLVLLHDDFAVIAYNAEPGASWQTLFIAVLLAAIPAGIGRRPAAPDAAKAARWLRIGAGCLAAAWAIAAVLSVVGMVRYGGGPLVGLRSSFAPIPIAGAFVNSFLFLGVALMALWVLALSGWAVARRRTIDPIPLRVQWLAYAAAAGAPVFAILLALEYGNPAYAAVLGLVPAAIILAAVHMPRRSPA